MVPSAANFRGRNASATPAIATIKTVTRIVTLRLRKMLTISLKDVSFCALLSTIVHLTPRNDLLASILSEIYQNLVRGITL